MKDIYNLTGLLVMAFCLIFVFVAAFTINVSIASPSQIDIYNENTTDTVYCSYYNRTKQIN